MKRRNVVPFLILNVLVSLAVVLGVIFILQPGSNSSTQQVVITVPILVTATRDPLAGPTVIVVTATPRPGEVSLPDGVVEASTPTLFAPTVILGADLTRAAVPTVDETLQAGDPETAATVAALPANCIPYTITEGDTPFGIALELGADFTELMTVNQLTEESASLLQIGQVLIVPLPGCALAAEAAAPTLTQDAILALTPSSTPTEVVDGATTVPGSGQANAGPATTIPTPTATLQLPPTAANALVQISSVVGVGDVTAEGITILNTGTSISLNGWTVRDADGNTYTFSDRRLFPNAQVILFSGVGQDTAAAVYWNRDSAVLTPGEQVIIVDADGNTQSVFIVP